MAHAQFVDEMVKEYLLFRGFGITLKAFDGDLKADKDKSFRVDKIIEQILHFVSVYDINSLRELWSHFDSYMFTKLEAEFMPAVKKLENAVLKLYLVNCISNNKPDKIADFFVKMTPELQNQNEWKDWFVIPYLKNPDENPNFSLHFTKQWQDTLVLSLHNFLASIFQYMPTPTIMSFEEDIQKISRLEERNESLKNRLALLLDKGAETSVAPCQVEPPPHLLDDFYIIAQENTNIENQGKGLKNLIRNIGSSTSPILGRKDNYLRKKIGRSSRTKE